MDTVNQLILDCMARVLRINQTTDAEISFQFHHTSAFECNGWKNGYANAALEQDVETPEYDFDPLEEVISLKFDDAETALKNLLASLDALEKELENNEN